MDAKGLHDFYFDDLKWCGCGNPDEALAFVGCVLGILKRRSEDNDLSVPYDQSPWKRHTEELRATLGEGPLGLILMYVLDAHDLTEHGGNVMGSWLTPKGMDVLNAINEHGDEVFDLDAAWRYQDSG